MFIDKIDFYKADLETAGGVYKEVTDRSFTKDGVTKPYRPKNVKMINGSGGVLEFCVFSNEEYTQYLSGTSVVSDLIPVEDGASETLTAVKGNITYVFAQGKAGESFTSGASCLMYQE